MTSMIIYARKYPSLFCIVIAALCFLYTLFTIQTILSLLILMELIRRYVYTKWISILQNGLIRFLPKKIQKNMLERSLFDVLCDFWFIPNFSKYIKVFIKPFFADIHPQKAAQVLDDLEPGLKQNFLKKGLINIFPDNIKNILYRQHEESSTLESQSQRNNQENNQMELANNQPVKWDRLEEFPQKQQLSGSNPFGQIKQNIQTLKQLLQFKSKGLLQNVIENNQISYSKLFKLFILSSALLIFQFMTSNKRRKQIINTFLITIYVLSIILSLSSLAMFGIKFSQNFRLKHNQQKKQIQIKASSCFDQ